MPLPIGTILDGKFKIVQVLGEGGMGTVYKVEVVGRPGYYRAVKELLINQNTGAEERKSAIERFDKENSRDPNTELLEGIAHPREQVYARWLTEWVVRLCPEASEELLLAARCQHICRWMVPRSSYPMTRVGYLQWREGLKRFHAEKSGPIGLRLVRNFVEL